MSLRFLRKLVSRVLSHSPARQSLDRRRSRSALRPRLEVLEDRWLLSTFTVTNNLDSGPGTLRQAILDANSQPGPNTINFNIATGAAGEIALPASGNSGPQGIGLGPDGNMWCTVRPLGLPLQPDVTRITPAGTITQFPLSFPPFADPIEIKAGPDGNLWFPDAGAGDIGRITPTGVTTAFQIPTFNSEPQGITLGSDGNLWFTEFANGTGKIGRITPVGTITEFSIPTANTNPKGIAAGPDGNLWFAERDRNKIGRITPSGIVTEFTLPAPNSAPLRVTAGPDSNLWFTEENTSKIGRITPNGTITEFATPNVGPSDITTGPDGNLWYTQIISHKIGRITPTGSVSEFASPPLSGAPFDIAPGPDGTLWFTERDANKVGRVTVAVSLTISPTSPLPTITHPVTIDGTTQPGFVGTPIIELNGASAGPSASGLTIDAGNSTVRGLVINRFSLSGIQLENNGGDIIQGNYIGTDVTGTATLGNWSAGIDLRGSNNTIGGTTTGARNLISGNGNILLNHGINISGIANLVEGNYIGTNAAGTTALANGYDGVYLGGSNNTIGGTTAGARNLISGNRGYGIETWGDGNLVEGNFLGTNAAGTGALVSSVLNAGIELVGSNNTIGGTTAGAGNLISGNSAGILITGNGNLVQGNFVGSDVNGTAALGNAASGLVVAPGASNNTIGGTTAGARNVISGNTGEGIGISGNANLVEGNYVGTNAAGTAALANGDGVYLGGSSNTIGGTTAGAGNLISGNAASGIQIGIGNANLVEGNYIGTNADGTLGLANVYDGIEVQDSNNTIGGTTAAAGNLISGNGRYGILISASANFVQGNYVGTNAAGTVALGNASDGVHIANGFSGATANNTVGGATTGAGNLISGNQGNGILITDTSATNNVVAGNYIGTDVNGALNLGNNGNGVAVVAGAHDNTIGGMADGAGNVIAFNGNDGVLIDTGTGNGISQNSMFANANLGIELLNGGNNNQPAPQLTSAVSGGGVTTVQGILTGQASTTYTLEFFAADSSGQGQVFLGSVTVTTDETGVATFSVDLAGELPLGQLVTATATDPANDTSAFSQAVVVSS
jgi:streptogramin lyase